MDKKVSKINITDMMRDRCEKRLRKVFKIKPQHLQYNRDPKLGELGSWILVSSRGAQEAIKLLIDKLVTIYIHRHHGSAFFKWDYYEQEFLCQLWSHQKLLDELKTGSIDDVKSKIKEYWNFCRYKKGTYKVDEEE